MVDTEIKNHILYITINREEKLNALNAAVLDSLNLEILKIYTDTSIYGAIIVGAGQKSFVAGADLEDIAALNDQNAEYAAQKGQNIFNLIENSPKPIIAVVNGFALGGGCELAMACHIRIATENAIFAQPEVNYGIIPAYGGSQRLPKLIGKGRALEMIMTGNNMKANIALNWGLVNYVLESKEMALVKAEEILNKIFEKSPLSISYAIECVNDGFKNNVDGYRSEVVLFSKCIVSDDFKVGTQAFIQKTKPVFKR